MAEDIEKEILKKFMYNSKLKYNQIWDKKLCSSSHFDYHLKKLIEGKLIAKSNEYYELTNEGFSFISSLDGISIENKKKPIACSFALAYKDGKVLLNKRKKQPFLNHYNIPGGKIEFGYFSKEEALREFEEETGLTGDLELKVISEKITYDKQTNEVSHHIIGFFYLVKNISGDLILTTREGDNGWYNLSEIAKFEKFKELDILIPQIINGKKLKYYTFKRLMENQKITEYEIIEEI